MTVDLTALDEQFLLPGRTLIVVDYPGQEFAEFAPLLAHTTPARSRIILLRVNTQESVAAFEASMGRIGVGEWDAWVYAGAEPPALDALTRRIADAVDAWMPQWVVLGSSVPCAALVGRPPLRADDSRPSILRVHEEGWQDNLLTLMLPRPTVEQFQAWATASYGAHVPVRTAQIYERYT